MDDRSYWTTYGILRTQALLTRDSLAKRRRIALEKWMWEKARGIGLPEKGCEGRGDVIVSSCK